MLGDERGESVEKRSEDMEQSLMTAQQPHSLNCQSTTLRQKPVLLIPRRPTSTADTAMQATMTMLSDAAVHSDGND